MDKSSEPYGNQIRRRIVLQSALRSPSAHRPSSAAKEPARSRG
ncbi:MAG TPA: hypothetical protein VHT00_21190 [Stellaceae bacterium]|jgi:hypothetical protein|nr:hypothetical protein [Stellaceae bacterium]